jgi:benzoyl-CoA reductase/2-hydroxyglutaryl-CoA dehydratase subunit BcrC/BadD/HgdB
MAKKVYREFLETLGFSSQECDEMLPRWVAVAKKLGLKEKDVTYSISTWIPDYWNLQLKGVRLALQVYFKELLLVGELEEFRQKGGKLVYGTLPCQTAAFRAIELAGGDNVVVCFPDFVMMLAMSIFFHKQSMLVEDDCYLSNRCRHCGINKTRFNACQAGRIPFPDVMWSWGFFCNEATKTEELIQEVLEPQWHYVMSALPHDSYLGEHEEENPARVKQMAKELEQGHKEIGKILGITIEHKHVYDALRETGNYTKKLDELISLVANSDPQPISGNELALFSGPMGMAFSDGFEGLGAAIDVMLEEVKQLVAQKKGILPEGAPKLGAHFVPVCIPWVEKAFRDNGVALSLSSYFCTPPRLFQAPKYLDPYQLLAYQWLQNPNAVNMDYEVELFAEMMKRFHVDGMLYGFFTFDRWLGSHQKILIGKIEEKTGIQHFYMEGDIWNDGNYKKEDRINRIENIAYFLKMNKLMGEREEQ